MESMQQKLVKVTYIDKGLIRVTNEGIPFIISDPDDEDGPSKLQKILRALISLNEGTKKGPGRPTQSPKNIQQRLGVVSSPMNSENIIEAEIHYPEAFQKFVCNVLKSAMASYVYFHFEQDKIILRGGYNHSGQEHTAPKLEMEINCNRLIRYYCEESRILCVQREFLDAIKTSNSKIHSKIYIYVKRGSKDTRMFISTDMGHDKGTTSDVSMGLSSSDGLQFPDMSNVQDLAIINMQSQFLKNEVSSCKVAVHAEFILQKEEKDGVIVTTPMIKAYGSYAKDSKSIEKTVIIPPSNFCKSFTDQTINVKVNTNAFGSFVSMMSKFATNVNLKMGQFRDTKDGIIVFEMLCDNEENNIFYVFQSEIEEKIKHLYGNDYICRCYCINRLQQQ